MKLYTDKEMNKVFKSFRQYLKKNAVPECNFRSEVYFPESIDVELTGKVIRKKNNL